MSKQSFRKLQLDATQALAPPGMRLPHDRRRVVLQHGIRVALALHWLRLPSQAAAAKTLLREPEVAAGVAEILDALAANQ